MNNENGNIDLLNELLRQNLLLNESRDLELQILERDVTYKANPAKIEEFITALNKNISNSSNISLQKIRHLFLKKWTLFVSTLICGFTGILVFSDVNLNNRNMEIETKSDKVQVGFDHSIIQDTTINNKGFKKSEEIMKKRKELSIINNTKNIDSIYITSIKNKRKQPTSKLVINETEHVKNTQDKLKTKSLEFPFSFSEIEKPTGDKIENSLKKLEKEKENTTLDTLKPSLSTMEFDIYFKDRKDIKLTNSSLLVLDGIGDYLVKHPKCELFVVEKDKCQRKVLLRRIEAIKTYLRKYKIYTSRIEFKLTPDYNKTKRKGTQYKSEKYFKLNVRNQKSQHIVLYISNSISAD